MLEGLFDNVDVMQKSMQGLTARQRAISENVSNADTPGYKRLQVNFERQLRDAIKSKAEASDELELRVDSPRHFSLGPNGQGGVGDVQPEMTQITDESYRNDKNNVDIEVEMSNLAETNVRFNTMATLARGKFDGIKNILREIR